MSRFWGWSFVHIIWLKIGHHFEPEVWLRFWSWIWSLFQKPKVVKHVLEVPNYSWIVSTTSCFDRSYGSQRFPFCIGHLHCTGPCLQLTALRGVKVIWRYWNHPRHVLFNTRWRYTVIKAGKIIWAGLIRTGPK